MKYVLGGKFVVLRMTLTSDSRDDCRSRLTSVVAANARNTFDACLGTVLNSDVPMSFHSARRHAPRRVYGASRRLPRCT